MAMSDSTPPPPPQEPPPGGGYNPPPGGYNPPPGGYNPPPGGYGSTPPPPPPGYGAAPGYGPPVGNNSKAIWALVLGILGLLCCGFFTGIPAIILGKQAQNEIDRTGGAQGGRGMATAGFVLGIIACVWGVVSIILYATGVLTFSTSTS
jgi:Domain of unknown function (DUF4190)